MFIMRLSAHVSQILNKARMTVISGSNLTITYKKGDEVTLALTASTPTAYAGLQFPSGYGINGNTYQWSAVGDVTGITTSDAERTGIRVVNSSQAAQFVNLWGYTSSNWYVQMFNPVSATQSVVATSAGTRGWYLSRTSAPSCTGKHSANKGASWTAFTNSIADAQTPAYCQLVWLSQSTPRVGSTTFSRVQFWIPK
jgi:hypothetical protein